MTRRNYMTAGLWLVLLSAPTVPAEPEALLRQDFETQVPGQIPQGWGRAWGSQGEDLFRVSSEHSCSGTRSMLFDRLSGETSTMWGLQRYLPNFREGKARISLSFCILGPGNLAHFSLEFRGQRANTDRLFAVGFKDLEISLRSYAEVGKAERSVRLGQYRQEQWYSLTLTVPATPADGRYVDAELVEINHPSQKTSARIALKFPQKEFGVLMLCTAPGKAGYRIFFDDLLVTKLTPGEGNTEELE